MRLVVVNIVVQLRAGPRTTASPISVFGVSMPQTGGERPGTRTPNLVIKRQILTVRGGPS
jgi:hypothetical protein